MSINLKKPTELSEPSRFRSAYSQKLVVALEFPSDSEFTDQTFRDECDINTIMAKYQSTGEMPVLNGSQGQWLDVTEMDFQRHMQFMVEAQEMFDQLPSAIRDRFGNDPGAFLGFVSDRENTVEIAKMGLLTPESAEAILYPKQPQAPLPKEEA